MRSTHFPEGAECPTCRGSLVEGITIFTTTIGKAVMVVHDTPAIICQQCGEELFTSETSRRLDEIAADIKRKGALLEVVNFASDHELVVA